MRIILQIIQSFQSVGIINCTAVFCHIGKNYAIIKHENVKVTPQITHIYTE